MNLMLRVNKSLILSGFFFIQSFLLQAQQYTFINYSTEQGLAQSQVSAMCQDKKGYLWFATFGGVSRFDGISFTSYSKSDGLVENQVYTIFEDSQHRLWFGAIGGYSRFDGETFYSEKFPAPYLNLNITSICEDRAGRIWLAFDGAGLICLLPDGTQLFYGLAQGLDPYVRSVFSDSKGRLWAGTRGGLFLFDNGRFALFPLNGDPDRNVSFITEDQRQRLWIATYDEGVFMELEKEGFRNYYSDHGLISDWVRTIFVDADNAIWFGTKTGVSKLDHGEFQNFGYAQGLINTNIKVIGQDSEGNMWLGTDGKGVLKFAGEAFTTYTSVDGLSSDFVMSVAEDLYGNLWFATYGEGICRFDGKRFTVFKDDAGLANNTAWTCIADKQNRIWVGTSNGLSMYDGRQFFSYFEEDGLLSNKITSLFSDTDGSLWIGNKDGLSHLKNNKFINYTATDGLTGGNVRSIHKDRKGVLWLGTSDGLYSFDGSRFVNYKHESHANDNTVYSIAEDRYGNLWIGSKSGLFCFRNQLFYKLSLGQGITANTVNFLIFENDRLWVGTNNSLYEVNVMHYLEKGEVEYRNYSKLEGVPGLESNMNAAFRDTKGNLWFGTDGGLVRFNPQKRRHAFNPVEPYVHITDIRLFFEPVKWDQYAKEKDPATGLARDLVVPYKKNHFTFYYTGICHTNPNKVKYRFKLEGFDQDWSPETDARFATYSNLPSGHYTFKVMACNNSGIWTSVPAEFSFSITPPFWFTWWFYILCAAFAFTLGYLISRWRMAVIRRKNERTQLIYQSKLLSLEQQTLNASMNRHFIFNALNSIQYYINKQDKLEANRYLTSFAKLIRKNLDSSVSGNLVNLSEEMERLELYLSLENMRFKSKFSYAIEVDEEIDTESVKIPPMLLQPYVENSIWHGILPMERPGHIRIKVEPFEQDAVRITITDDGIGIDTSLKNKSKNGVQHVSRGIEITSGRLAILKKMTNENLIITGPYEMRSENGEVKGTEVVLVIPQTEFFRKANFSEKNYE